VPINFTKLSKVLIGLFFAFSLKLPALWNPTEAETLATSSITVASKGICGAFDFTIRSIACCNLFLFAVDSVAICLIVFQVKVTAPMKIVESFC